MTGTKVPTNAAAAELLFGATPRLHGLSIREKKKGTANFSKLPELLTLMAIGMDPNSFELWVRTYKFKITKNADLSEIKNAEKHLLQDAMNDSATNGAIEVSRDVDKIDFFENSYFTIVICIKGWNFVFNEKFYGHDQFRFYGSKDQIIGNEILTIPKHENHSFFDAEADKIDGFSAVRCINYRKREKTETDLDYDEDSPFGFNIYLEVTLIPFIPVAKRVVVIIDPTGENKGPQRPPLVKPESK